MTEEVTKLGRYHFIRKLGAGGMAEVYLSRSHNAQGIEKLLVVKKILPVLARNNRFITMFIDEAKVAMSLNHPNIVQVYSFEQAEGHYLLAMEFVDGFDLVHFQKNMKSKGLRLPYGLSAFIAREVAKGLDYAHDRRDEQKIPLEIVHRDVSPQNILVSYDGSVKITDFGIAKARLVTDDADGTIKGKISYMSPEQAMGRAVDRRSDIFSLGIVLHEFLTGKNLLTGLKPAEAMEILKQGSIKTPLQIDPAVPGEISRIVERAMAVDVVERYQTAREIIVDLGKFLHNQEEYFDASALERYIRTTFPSDSLVQMAAVPEKIGTTAAAKPSKPLGSIEHRDVVIVSGRFVPPDPDAEWVERYRKRLKGIVEEMAYKAEGMLISQPDSGFLIYLGLPFSSVDDAVRGVRLGLDLIESATGLGRDVGGVPPALSIGLARGQTMCRLESEGRYSITEPDSFPAESARHLSATAQAGEVLAVGGVYRLSRREFDFLSSEESDIKVSFGRTSRRIRYFKAIGVKSRESRLSDIANTEDLFYGRELELWSMERAFRQAMVEQRPRISYVIGEMGIGKSRFIQKFLESRDRDLCLIMQVECLYAERAIPWTSTQAIIRELFRIDEEADLEDIHEELQRGMSKLISKAPRLSRTMANGLFEFINRSVEKSDQLLDQSTQALGYVISAFSRKQRLVIFFDNAQWMDPLSAELFSTLYRRGSGSRVPQPIHVILASRPEAEIEKKLSSVERIELRELRESVRKKMVMDRLVGGSFSEDLAEEILSKTGGNPMFINEVFEALVENGVLRRSPDGIRLTPSKRGSVVIPTTLEGLVAARLDALSSEERLVLRIASAAGTAFTADQISELASVEAEGILEKLVTKELLVSRECGRMRDAADTGKEYSFSQSVVREVAYRSLRADDRRRVHRWMARHLMQDGDDNQNVYSALVAWHLEHAGDTARAGALYLNAADAARRANSTRESRQLYDKAITLLPSGSNEEFYSRAQREHILRGMGLQQERLRDIEALVLIADNLGDQAKRALALNRRARFHVDQGRYDEGRTYLNQALDSAVFADDIDQRVEALRILAIVEVEEGLMSKAVEYCDSALEILDSEKSTGEHRANVLNSKGIALTYAGKLSPAIQALIEAMVIFNKLGITRMKSIAMSNLAVLAYHFGEYQDGLNLIEKALELDAALHDRYARARKMATKCSILAEIGEIELAQKYLGESEIFSIESEDDPGLVEVLLAQVDAYLQFSDMKRAAEVLERLRDRDEDISRLSSLGFFRLMADFHFLGDNFEESLKAAGQMLEVATSMGATGEEIHALARTGLCASAMHDSKAAVQAANRAMEAAEPLDTFRRADEALWLTGKIFHIQGELERAVEAGARALKETNERRKKLMRPDFRKAYENHPRFLDIKEFNRKLSTDT